MKLAIEKAIYGGDGLAHVPPEAGELAGKAIFVPFALPGEVVEAELASDEGSFARAAPGSLLRASPARTTPRCPYFGLCGGCHYQHATYPEQLQLKSRILEETLARAGVRDLPVIQTLSGPEYGYRNRIRLHVDRRNEFRIGYHARASHELLDVAECPIAAPLLQETLRALRLPHVIAALPPATRQLELFCTSGEAPQAQVLVSLYAPKAVEQPALDAFATTLAAAQPAVAGVSAFLSSNDRKPPRLSARSGAAELFYSVGATPLRVSAGAFFQTNRFLLQPLRDLVVADRTGALAWDLYAGVGLFASALAAGFQSVTAVEASAAALPDLAHNMRNTTPSARVVRSTTLDFLRRETAARNPARPGLIIVDPPRAGLGKPITDLLTRIRATQIVYVSCDPATLSRDLRALIHSGYTARQMHLVDLFPQTFHLETVTVLDLRA